MGRHSLEIPQVIRKDGPFSKKIAFPSANKITKEEWTILARIIFNLFI